MDWSDGFVAFQCKVGERYPLAIITNSVLSWSKCLGITWTMRIPLCSQWHNIWAGAHGTRLENHGKLSYIIMDSQILETGRLTWIWLDSQFQLTHVFWRIEHFHLILASRHEIGDVRLVRSCCRSTCWHGCFLLIPQKRSTGESWRPAVLETPWPPTAGHETTTALHATCEILSEFLKKTVLLEKSLHQIWRVRIDTINFLSPNFVILLPERLDLLLRCPPELSSKQILSRGPQRSKFLSSHEWWASVDILNDLHCNWFQISSPVHKTHRINK